MPAAAQQEAARPLRLPLSHDPHGGHTLMPVNRVKRHGSFAPLSVNYYDDDKIIAAGEKAEVLFTRGLAFCARTLSDGFISDLQLTTFRLPAVKSRAQKLVAVGLWERVDG